MRQACFPRGEKQVKIAVMHFSGWTGMDAIAEQFPDSLDQPMNAAIPTSLDAYSQVFASQKMVAEQQVKVAESQLLPQLNSGVLFQQVAGDVPFFGYQLGVNMPLFRKGYDARIEITIEYCRTNRSGIVEGYIHPT